MTMFTMISTLIISMAISYGGGCAFRSKLLNDSSQVEATRTTSEYTMGGELNGCTVEYPILIEHDGFSDTAYTTKQFNMKTMRKCTSVMSERRKIEDGNAKDEDEDDDDDEEESHIVDPSAGQQLLVEIKNADADFLNDEVRLAQALVEIVTSDHDECMTKEEDMQMPALLSHHCYSLNPKGVSCVGLLVKGHFSLHTWPEAGVISLDIYTSPSSFLVHLMPAIKRAFGVKSNDEIASLLSSATKCDGNRQNCSELNPHIADYLAYDPPRAFWRHKLRGFRTKQARLRPLENDISDEIFDNVMDYIEPIATAESIFQQIDIYDVISPKKNSLAQYELSIGPDKSRYEAQHPELFAPQRIVFLDGVTQSTRTGDQGYHEVLVHPAMFAHPNPRRAAIIGGGEGATLREILRHKTIDNVKMVEIDQVMVEVSREYLPFSSDCSDLVGSTENCFDEPRADVLYQDAIAWFADRTFYPPGTKEKEDDEVDVEQFDVIIVDALDPQDNIPFTEIIYVDPKFLTSIYNALTDDGILVMQLGPGPDVADPEELSSTNKNRVKVFNLIENLQFEAIQVYEEPHSGFESAWTFVIACKSISCRDNLFASEAAIQIAIHDRLIPTKSGKPTLKFFDGTTMSKYLTQSPHWETVYCRAHENESECQKSAGFQRQPSNILPSTGFEVTEEGELVSKTDIVEGDLLMVDQQVSNVFISSNTMNIVDSMQKEFHIMGSIVEFAKKYALDTKYTSNEAYVPSGLWNFAKKSDDANTVNAYLHDGNNGKTVDGILNMKSYSPVVSRRYKQAVGSFEAKRDIPAGEAISF